MIACRATGLTSGSRTAAMRTAPRTDNHGCDHRRALRRPRSTTSTDPGLAGPELLPVRLARACARMLPVDDAGLSLVDAAQQRVPLGASSDVAEVAERLQFTVGAGPCMTAQETRQPVFAVEDDLRAPLAGVHRPARRRHPVPGGRRPAAAARAGRRRGDRPLLRATRTTCSTSTSSRRWPSASWSPPRSATPPSGRRGRRTDGPEWLHGPAPQRRAARLGGDRQAQRRPRDRRARRRSTLLRAHAYGARPDGGRRRRATCCPGGCGRWTCDRRPRD